MLTVSTFFSALQDCNNMKMLHECSKTIINIYSSWRPGGILKVISNSYVTNHFKLSVKITRGGARGRLWGRPIPSVCRKMTLALAFWSQFYSFSTKFRSTLGIRVVKIGSPLQLRPPHPKNLAPPLVTLNLVPFQLTLPVNGRGRCHSSGLTATSAVPPLSVPAGV